MNHHPSSAAFSPAPSAHHRSPAAVFAAAMSAACMLSAAGMSISVVLCLSAPTAAAAEAVEDGFIRLPGGTLTLGSPESEPYRESDETRHEVSLSPFWVDPHEVSQADYSALMGENPSARKGPRLPVENVTWLNAIRYCNALSARAGLEPAYVIDGEAVTWKRSADGYRLLTEAEWEYAARAGTATPFSTGAHISTDAANYHGSYPYLIETNYVSSHDPQVRTGRNRGQTMEVDALPPNALGLHHMHGNVAEWVFDYYAPYPASAQADPAGPASGTYRVNRGGGFNDFAKHVRSAYRSAANPIDADPNLGFRVARNAQPLAATLATTAPWRLSMPEHPRVLLVYFSYSGNVRHGAELMARELGVPAVEIKLQQPYRGNIYDVSGREAEQRARPALATQLGSLEDYDVVVLGYPTWWASMPMAVFSFLESHDLSGRIILPFSSHGGTVWGDSVSALSKTARGAYVGVGTEYHYSGGSGLAEQLRGWLRDSGLLR